MRPTLHTKDMENKKHMTVSEFIDCLRSNPSGFSFVGGYPLFFITRSGLALSYDHVRSCAMEYARSTRDREGLAIVGCHVNWENPDLYCDVTGERIESAYVET